MAAPEAEAWEDPAAGIGMVPAADEPLESAAAPLEAAPLEAAPLEAAPLEAAPLEAAPSVDAPSGPDGPAAGAGAWGALAVNALGPADSGCPSVSRSANACEGPAAGSAAGSSAVGGWPMCTAPGTRKAVVVSAFTFAEESDASGASSSDSGGDAGAPP
ncbi:hypothetical protein [Nonomuraea sp. NPDC005692]|uniref:hypothetical protein n=1 Tax=Nonomuraea sp. NPDC005692 TaxID=3157168 RepID=UPI0033E6BDFD